MAVYETELETLDIGPVQLRIERLKDRQQFSDPAGAHELAGVGPATWALFGVVWEAGLRLAEVMIDEPICNRRFLELGCGLALPSLILHRRGADVLASDLHPLAGKFLQQNLILNNLPELAYTTLDWRKTYPELGKFDVVIGSDLLYEPDQPLLLANFADVHCLGEMIVTDAGRKQMGAFNRLMEARGFVLENIESGKFARYRR